MIFPPVKTLNLTAFVLLIFPALGIAISLERYEALGEVREEAQGRHLEVVQAISQIQRTVEQHNLSLEKEMTQFHKTLMTTAIAVKPLIGND